MRRIRLLLAVLAAAVLLGLPARAAIEQYDVGTLHVAVTVTQDGTYTAELTASLAFESADTTIEIPLGTGITEASAPGYGSQLRRNDDGVYFLTISTESGFLTPGNYTVRYAGSLGFTTREDGGQTAAIELLCAHWPGTVSGVTFAVTMPAAIDAGAATLVSGYYGELAGDAVTLTAAGTALSGGLDGTLLDHESLSLALTLPAGYFTEPSPVETIFSPDRLIVPVVCVLSLLYWLLFLRTPGRRIRMQVEPPDGVCAGDVPYLLYGARPEAALTVAQWASLGYCSIQASRRAVRLIRHMDMGNERKGYERRLFAQIFAPGDVVSGSDTRFRQCCEHIEQPLGAHWQRRIFDRRSGSPALMQAGAAIACAAACARAMAAIDQITVAGWLMAVLGAAGGLAAGALVCCGALQLRRRRKLPVVAAAAVALAGMLLLGAFSGIHTAVLLSCALACFTGCETACGGRRTRAGAEALAHLRGLRRFLAGAEEKRLRRLLRNDPQYFYRMLPFAEALGVGRAFSARFGRLRLEPCDYYQTGGTPAQTADGFYARFHDSMEQMRGR